MKLDNYTEQWIMDRIDNGEPLYWSEFIKFMRDMIDVPGNVIKMYKTKRYSNLVKKEYKRMKESW